MLPSSTPYDDEVGKVRGVDVGRDVGEVVLRPAHTRVNADALRVGEAHVQEWVLSRHVVLDHAQRRCGEAFGVVGIGGRERGWIHHLFG